jgi:hypothetical protein
MVSGNMNNFFRLKLMNYIYFNIKHILVPLKLHGEHLFTNHTHIINTHTFKMIQ